MGDAADRRRRTAADPDRLQALLRDRLRPAATEDPGRGGFRDAAVLIPFVAAPDGPSLLFLRRPEFMREHSGQIAFPGGRADPGETMVETALREAEEELGIPTAEPKVLGRIAGVPTVTSYWIHPVVAWLDRPPVLTPNPAEVAESFYARVDGLLDPTIHSASAVSFGGRERHVHYFHYPHPDGDTRIIWGATARVLCNLFGEVFDWRAEPAAGAGPTS